MQKHPLPVMKTNPNGKSRFIALHRMIAKIPPACLILCCSTLLALGQDSGKTTVAASDRREAAANARKILVAFQNPSQQPAALKLIGADAFFKGTGPVSGNDLDLTTKEGITIHVEMKPRRDPDLGAVGWAATVHGKIEAIDFKRRVITIACVPGDWAAGDAL